MNEITRPKDVYYKRSDEQMAKHLPGETNFSLRQKLALTCRMLANDGHGSGPAGQITAIVGLNGAGKTTLVSLIARFYDPVSGEIKIDGTDIRRYRLKSLRDQISFVLQDTLLFHATIWENIAYGKPGASPKEIKRAAKLANAHDFIEEMPDGYETMVGERGVTLSGGQRQRIAIARAVIRDTPILVLDEPTVGLDAASEQSVIEALDELMKGKTSVVIAHHLDTIRHADVIFVMKDCELVEQGTHDELLASNGAYAELHAIQNPKTDAPAAVEPVAG
jgi:subfamily B ATP-binding cassette protein MsbA